MRKRLFRWRKKQANPNVFISSKRPRLPASHLRKQKKTRGFSNPFKRKRAKQVEVSASQISQEPPPKQAVSITRKHADGSESRVSEYAQEGVRDVFNDLNPDIQGPDIHRLDDIASEKDRLQNQITDIPQDAKNKVVNTLEDKRDDALRAPENLKDTARDGLRFDNLKEASGKLLSPKVLMIAGIALGVLMLIAGAIVVGFYMGTKMNKSTYEPPTTPAPIDLTGNSASTTVASNGAPQPIPIPGSAPSDSSSATESFIWPVDETARVTSCFGVRTLLGGFSNHKGLDIGLPQGTPIIASKTGIIEYSEVNAGPFGYGTYVVLKHDDGFRTLYAHLQPQLNLKWGQTVKQREAFATSGNTGYSTGPHLHFEIIDETGKKTNPAQYISSRAGSTLFKTGDDTCWYKSVLALQSQ